MNEIGVELVVEHAALPRHAAAFWMHRIAVGCTDRSVTTFEDEHVTVRG